MSLSQGSSVDQQEIVARLIATNTAALRNEIEVLRKQLETVVSINNVCEYTKQTIDPNIACDESLEVIKSMPEFNGRINGYVSWRESANSSMSLYEKGSKRYFAALTILRNKITGEANDVLTNHGTVLNFDAILSRLDFAYADKRPIHIIEQELSILRQGNMSLIEYYNQVNKKLTLLINKTIMTYGSDTPIVAELNKKNRDNALRVFITGLNGNLSNILFSLNPEDLPNALAKAMELESNNIRASFALQFNKGLHNNAINNLRFPSNRPFNRNFAQNNNFNKQQPMEVDPTVSHRPLARPNWQQPVNWSKPQNFGNQWRSKEPMKRPLESSQKNLHPQMKMQRINNINENHFLGGM